MIVGARYDHVNFQERCYEEIRKFSHPTKTNYESPLRFKQTNISSSTDLFDDLTSPFEEEEIDDNSISSVSVSETSLKSKRKKKLKKKKKLKTKSSSLDSSLTKASNGGSNHNLTKTELMNELLAVKGEVGNALTNFNSELTQLKDNIEHRKYVDQEVYFLTPTGAAGESPSELNDQQQTAKISDYEIEIVTLKKQMKDMLSQLKDVQKQLIDQTNRESKLLKEKERDHLSSKEIGNSDCTFSPTKMSMPKASNQSESIHLTPLPNKVDLSQSPSVAIKSPEPEIQNRNQKSEPVELLVTQTYRSVDTKSLPSTHSVIPKIPQDDNEVTQGSSKGTVDSKSLPSTHSVIPKIPQDDNEVTQGSSKGTISPTIPKISNQNDLTPLPNKVDLSQSPSVALKSSEPSTHSVIPKVPQDDNEVAQGSFKGTITISPTIPKISNQNDLTPLPNKVDLSQSPSIAMKSPESEIQNRNQKSEPVELSVTQTYRSVDAKSLPSTHAIDDNIFENISDTTISLVNHPDSPLDLAFTQTPLPSLSPHFAISNEVIQKIDVNERWKILKRGFLNLVREIRKHNNQDIAFHSDRFQTLSLLIVVEKTSDLSLLKESIDLFMKRKHLTLAVLTFKQILKLIHQIAEVKFGDSQPISEVNSSRPSFIPTPPQYSFSNLVDTLFPDLTIFSSLLDTFLEYPSLHSLTFQTITCILSRSPSSDIYEDLGSTGICSQLITLLRKEYSSDISLDDCHRYTLQNLDLCCLLLEHSSKNRYRFGNKMSCLAIAENLKKFCSDSEIITKLIRFLHIICKESAIILTRVGENGVCEALLYGLEINMMRFELMELFARGILILCTNHHRVNQSKFGTIDNFQIILECIHTSFVSSDPAIIPSTFTKLTYMLEGVLNSNETVIHVASLMHPSFFLVFQNVIKDSLRLLASSSDFVVSTCKFISSVRRYKDFRPHILEFCPIFQEILNQIEQREGEEGAVPRKDMILYLQKIHNKLLALEDHQLRKGYSRSNSNMSNDGIQKKRDHSKKRIIESSDTTSPLSVEKITSRVEGPAIDTCCESIGERERSSSPLPQVSLLKSPTPPHPSQQKSNSNKVSSHRKLIQPTESSEFNDPPLAIPSQPMIISSDDMNSILGAQKNMKIKNSHDDAVRVIQNVFRRYQLRQQAKSRDIRIISLRHIIPTSTDSEIILEAVKTSVEFHHEELGLLTLKRMNELLKIAKESKIPSPVIVLLVHKPSFFIRLLAAFDSNDLYLEHGYEILSRLSYAGGACESLGKDQVFPFLFHSLARVYKNVNLCSKIMNFAVRLVSKCPQNQLRGGTSENFRIITEIFLYHFTDPTDRSLSSTILDKTAKFICHCMEKSPETQNNYRESGGLDAIIKIMSTPSIFIPFLVDHSSSKKKNSVLESVCRLILNLCALNNTTNLMILGDQKRLANYLDLFLFFLREKVSLEALKSISSFLSSFYSSSALAIPEIRDSFLSLNLISYLQQALDGIRSEQLIEEEHMDGIILVTLALLDFFASIPFLKDLLASSSVIPTVREFQDQKYRTKIRKYAQGIISRLTGDGQTLPSGDADEDDD